MREHGCITIVVPENKIQQQADDKKPHTANGKADDQHVPVFLLAGKVIFHVVGDEQAACSKQYVAYETISKRLCNRQPVVHKHGAMNGSPRHPPCGKHQLKPPV